MNPYYNLSSEQQHVQKLADHFNADEHLWRSLEGKRRLRRRLYPRLSAKLRKQLDLLDFAAARQPQDCVGFSLPHFDVLRILETWKGASLSF